MYNMEEKINKCVCAYIYSIVQNEVRAAYSDLLYYS